MSSANCYASARVRRVGAGTCSVDARGGKGVKESVVLMLRPQLAKNGNILVLSKSLLLRANLARGS